MYTGQKYILLVNVELQLKKEETIKNPASYSDSSADPTAS
jgi:hypothetical protein